MPDAEIEKLRGEVEQFKGAEKRLIDRLDALLFQTNKRIAHLEARVSDLESKRKD